MRKRFKSKKNTRRYRVLLFISIFFLTFYFVFDYLFNNIRKEISKSDIINYMMFKNDEADYLNIFKLNSTEFLINYSLGMDVFNKDSDEENVKGDYIEDPKDNKVEEPLVYLYNTHQTEGYNKDIITAYNIIPTVMLTSYILREDLNNLGIPTIVETAKITDILNNNDWVYKDSYKASRLLLDKSIEDNPSLKIFIDIHRDSSSYDVTTCNYLNESFAKLLFVVGKDHPNYESNLNNANKINEYIKKENNCLSRGVLEKSGNNVNGIYNQDFSTNVFLIEVGGQYNNIKEVKNSMNYLAKAIYNYVKENNI